MTARKTAIDPKKLGMMIDALGKARLNRALLEDLNLPIRYTMILTRWRRGIAKPTEDQVKKIVSRTAQFFGFDTPACNEKQVWLWLHGMMSTDLDTIFRRYLELTELKEYRESFELSQGECAKALQISRATLITKEKNNDSETLAKARNIYPIIAGKRSAA